MSPVGFDKPASSNGNVNLQMYSMQGVSELPLQPLAQSHSNPDANLNPNDSSRNVGIDMGNNNMGNSTIDINSAGPNIGTNPGSPDNGTASNTVSPDRIKTSKRLRIANACQVCRDRKVRCDGQMPVCGSCLRRRTPCNYATKNSKSRINPNYVKELESKLRFYEGGNAGNKSNLASNSAASPAPNALPNMVHTPPVVHAPTASPIGAMPSGSGSRTSFANHSTPTVIHPLSSDHVYLADQQRSANSGFYDHFSVAPNVPEPGSGFVNASGINSNNGNTTKPSLSRFPLITSPSSPSANFVARSSYGFPPVGNVNMNTNMTSAPQQYSQTSQPRPAQASIINQPAGSLKNPVPAFPLNSPASSTGSFDNMGSTAYSLMANNSCATSISPTPSDVKHNASSATSASAGFSSSSAETTRQPRDLTGGPSTLSFVKLVEAAATTLLMDKKNNQKDANENGNSIDMNMGNLNGNNSTKSDTTTKYTIERPPESTSSLLTSLSMFSAETDDPSNLELKFPDRQHSDAIMDSYFQTIHPVFPVLHEQTVRALYNSLWDQQAQNQQAQNQNQNQSQNHSKSEAPLVAGDSGIYILLNLVFAVSTLIEDRGLDLCPEGEMYFQYAISRMSLFFVSEKSLLTVQCMLLACIASMRVCHTEITLYFYNTAIYSAQNLGLDTPRYIASISNKIEKEVSIRVWIYCYSMDKLLALTYGKPLNLTLNTNTLLPTKLDDEYITDDKYLTPPEHAYPSYQEFTHAFYELFNIVDDIIRTFYEPFSILKLESSAERTLSNIFRLEEKLQDLHKRIPSYLCIERWLDNDALSIKQQTQCTVFQCRFLHAKILLYRVMMVDRLFKQSPYELTLKEAELQPRLLDSPLGMSHNGYLQQCFETAVGNLSVSTSIQIIELIDRTSIIKEGPVRWLRTFYVYMACIVLLNAKLLPTLNFGLNQESVARAWKMAIDILRQQSTTSMIANKCLKVLEVLHEKIGNYGADAYERHVELLPNVENYDFDIGDTNMLRNALNDAYLFPLFKD